MSELKAKAEGGDPAAQVELGLAYKLGTGVAKDPDEEIKWYRKAARQDYAPAQVELGFSYFYGDGVKQDLHAALTWFDKAVQTDPGLTNAEVSGVVPWMYLEGKEGVLKKNPERAFEIWTRAAAAGNGRAQCILGILSEEGKNYAEAFKWLSSAVTNDWGHYFLGMLYREGHGIERDEAKAFDLFSAGATNACSAIYGLGLCYRDGLGVRSNAEMAASCFKAAIGDRCSDRLVKLTWAEWAFFYAREKRTEAEASFSLAEMYRDGAGGPGRGTEAADLFGRLAYLHEDDPSPVSYRASKALADMYARGRGVQRDERKSRQFQTNAAQTALQLAHFFTYGSLYLDGPIKNLTEGLKWYYIAAEDGGVEAMEKLSSLLAEANKGDAKDSLFWTLKAAEGGSKEKQFMAGTAYLLGDGVSRDLERAVKWFKEAATGEDPGGVSSGRIWADLAKLSLAGMYERGDGVIQNWPYAAALYKELAEAGFPPGQDSLGACYAAGRGVPQDFVEAYKWFNLAATDQLVTNAVTHRAAIARAMTRDQIAEGQRRSAGYLPAMTHSYSSRPSEKTTPIKATGSAFFITADGYALTSFHVVEGASRIEANGRLGRFPAKLVKADRVNDVALLKVEIPDASNVNPLAIAPSRAVKLGESVFTIGFPNTLVQGLEPKLTRGEISSLAGIRDDPRHFQISVAVQPGNSGGALVNRLGNVVGIVTLRLDDMKALELTGSLPQSVNYALKSSFLATLVETIPELSTKLKDPNTKERNLEDVIKDVEQASLLLFVY